MSDKQKQVWTTYIDCNGEIDFEFIRPWKQEGAVEIRVELVQTDEKAVDAGTTDKIQKLTKELSDANDTIDQIGKQVYDLNLHMLEQEKILSYVLATHDFDSPESYRDEVMEKKIQEFLSARSKEKSK